MYVYILFVLMCNSSGAAPLCSPVITEGSHSKKELSGHIYLKCDISTCNNALKVIFEKTDVLKITEWKPVFEGIGTTQYAALDTDDGYTLKQRNDYSVFPTYHLLYIRPFTIKDTGQWRCVLHHNDRRVESKAIDIYLAALCTPILTEGSHSEKVPGGHLYLECDISACDSVSRVVFEKTGVQQHSQWTPVFQGIDESHYAALDTGDDYTLKQRNKYSQTYHLLYIKHLTTYSPTYHLLYIKHLTMEDFGEWRCVLHQNQGQAESKAIYIVSVDGPHLTIKPKYPKAVVKHGETFTCEIDGIYTEPAFEWTVTSSSTSEKYYGDTTVSKQRDNGLWYANNVVKLTFNKPGKQTLKCSLTTKHGDPLIETYAIVDIKDKMLKNIYTVFACLLLVLLVILIYTMAVVKKNVKTFKDAYNRQQKVTSRWSAPRQTELKNTIQMDANKCSIWRAHDSNHVFLGGQTSPLITVISDFSTNTVYHIITGTRILHGLYLFDDIHIVNVYDEISSTYDLHSVCINLPSSDNQLIPQSTFNLSNECKAPRCIFWVDNSHVGVYSFKNCVVELFDVNVLSFGRNDCHISDVGDTEKKPQYLLPIELIKLSGYTAHECDMLSSSRNGQICVLSYRNSDVYGQLSKFGVNSDF